MKIITVGLSHKTAPLNVREKLAMDTLQTLKALRLLKNRFSESEFVLLSTCNRVELYCATKKVGGVVCEDLSKFLSDFHGIKLRDFQDLLYVYEDEDVVRHLLMVASSLDSMVVGEVQIIGQVKESYRLACSVKSTGAVLNRLFHFAFATGKKVHARTSISTGRISVAGVAVQLATQLFADITSAKVVLVGAGEMGELLVKHLLHVESRNITIINRSYKNGLKMANQYDITAGKWEEIDEQLVDANIVIASAASQDYLFTKNSFKKIMNRRKAALLIIDIAVPRNFKPDINDLEDVYLYSIDELSKVAEQNLKTREDDIAKGMQIVYENAAAFMNWFKARDIGPLIGQMKEKFAQVSRDELEKFFIGTREDASCKKAMEIMVNRIVGKLLHCVIENVNTVAKEHGPIKAARLIESIVQQADEISSEQSENLTKHKEL